MTGTFGGAAWALFILRWFSVRRILLILSLLMVGRSWDWWKERTPLLWAFLWVLYLQCGLLLLKVVFVRWRKQLPLREGRFYAGGLLYFNTDNPLALVRSPQGLAVNLAHRATFLWIAYVTGLIVLLAWQVSSASQ